MAGFSAPPTLVVTSIEAITHDGLTKIDLKNDGSRVYFTEVVHQRYLLSQVSAGGGEISRIASPLANTRVQDVAPDGSKLLVSEAANLGRPPGVLEILPLPSGTPRRLGALEGHTATWSLGWKTTGLCQVIGALDSGKRRRQPQKLMATSGVHWWLQFSPDGELIRYMLVSRNTGELWSRKPTGLLRLTLCCRDGTQPRTTPAVCGARMAGTMPSPSGPEHRKCLGSAGDAHPMVASERCTGAAHARAAELLCSRFQSQQPDLIAAGTMQRGELVRYDPSTRQVSPYLSGISAGDLAFSRDGRWIAYITYPDETLWRCRIDGSDRQQLTTTGSSVLPQWFLEWQNHRLRKE